MTKLDIGEGGGDKHSWEVPMLVGERGPPVTIDRVDRIDRGIK